MPSPTPVTASPTQLFQYRARVTAVYDGDTCTADIDLGLGIWVRGEKLRLHRINAPELRGADEMKGKAARDHLKTLIEGKEVLLQTIKDRREKYGRYLAEVWLEKPDAAPLNVNDALVAAGHAQYHDY
ncbi:MAG: thermonuclease family protein [Verrucomicrobia bacterium]|nr:thermonuclease family protein [Verrucomicrobiota bacterium]